MLFVVNLLYQRFGAIFMSIHQFVKLFCLNYQAYSPTLLVGKLSKLDKTQFIETFGDEELKFQKEIKDSPIITLIMTVLTISTVVYYLFAEKYVIVDKNIIVANVVLFFNIFYIRLPVISHLFSEPLLLKNCCNP